MVPVPANFHHSPATSNIFDNTADYVSVVDSSSLCGVQNFVYRFESHQAVQVCSFSYSHDRLNDQITDRDISIAYC